MAIINDYNELLDLFSRMTANETASYADALEYCKTQTTAGLAGRLDADIKKQIDETTKQLVDLYNRFMQEGKDARQIVCNWKHHTPCDIYGATLRALNLPQPATVIETKNANNVDIVTLQKYIDAGFYFYPCDNDKKPICKIKYANGAPIATNRIHHAQRLNDFINGTGTLYTDTGDKWTNKNKINVFSIYPNQFNLFCIDIDGEKKADGTTHGIGTNGINEFLNIIKNIDMTQNQKIMFDNFPANFPCYVTTPNGGIHLYFKLACLPDKWTIENNVMDHNTKTNVECKYNKQITIAGSIKDGKQYVLHGDLYKIPFIPLELLNKCCKPRPAPQKRTCKTFCTGTSKDITPQFCIDRGKNYAGYCGHNEMFASVVSNFCYFYKETHNEQLNASNCKSCIMQDCDFIAWNDNDKETQIENTIKQFYGRL